MVRDARRCAPHHEDHQTKVASERLRKADAYRSEAVRSTNDIVSSRAVDEPVKRSVTRPSVGSSEKVMAMIACGFTKCCRIAVRSASPNTVTDIDVLPLGASIIPRSQSSL